jgi:hypothetical protein
MQNIEKTISNLVESQFPAFYREEGPQFIAFVKAYYEWLEDDDNTLYHSRRMLDYRDIDTTIDDFLVHFKSKYLSSIQFETAVDTRRLVKHALDLYRSKGTERSMDLFFRSIFGVPATIYYPGDDVFKSSDGTWVLPQYLELFVDDNIEDFIGLQIEGINSGATAFVEKYIKKRARNSSYYSHLYYINNIVGSFQKGERIRSTSTGEVGPIVRGSVNFLNVVDGSSGYAIGDIVELTSEKNGIDAKARVANVASITGQVDFELENGGWGYDSNSQVLIAEKMLNIVEVDYEGTNNFIRFEKVAQPLVNLHYTSLTSNLTAGDILFKVDPADGLVYSEGVVLTINAVSSTEGYARLAIVYGKPDTEHDLVLEDDGQILAEDGIGLTTDGHTLTEDGYIYKLSRIVDESNNVIQTEDSYDLILEDYDLRANVASFTDVTAYANLIKYSANVTLQAALDGSTRFANGDFVYQVDESNNQVGSGTIGVASYSGSNASMSVIDYDGVFTIGQTIYSANGSATANVLNVTTDVGVINVVNEFFSSNGNLLIGLDSNTRSSISRIGQGSGANFSLGTVFDYIEQVSINTDYISDYANVELDSSDYGFPAPGFEDSNTLLSDALSFLTTNVGRITSIVVTNPGMDYDTIPYVVIYNRIIAVEDKRDYIINISNNVGTFVIGEAVLQGDEHRGIVKADSNSSIMLLERISFTDIDDESDLTGETSGATATPVQVLEDDDTEPVGINAIVLANTSALSGSVTSLEVIDSGFAYDNLENVTFSDGVNFDGTVEVVLSSHGTSDGYFKNNNSVLSGNKKLHDGDYYQEFSYEIVSSVVLNKYVDVLKNVMHLAGTRHFSRYVLESTSNSAMVATSSTIEGLSDDSDFAPEFLVLI